VPDLSVSILGPLEVRLDGAPVDLGAPKQRAVLALLAAHRGRAVSLDQLIEELWGDQAPPRATASLQAYVSNLRRVLEPDRRPRTPASVLVSRPPGYALALAADQVDADRFEALAATTHAARAEGRPLDAVATGREALALWRGEVLEDFRYERFAEEARRRLDEVRIELAQAVAEALLEAGEPGEAAGDLRALTREHPLRERLWELLMVALYRSGRQADALRAYQDARDVLGEELGLEPGPGLRRLEQQVLGHDPDLDLPNARAAVTPPPTPAPTPPEEPSAAPTFVGRDVERDAVLGAVDAARRGRTGFVLISGEAGIGKTTLVESVLPELQRRGCAVAVGRSFEQAGSAALWPWSQVVRAVLGDRPAEQAAAWLGQRAGLLSVLLPGEVEPTVDAGIAADRLRLFDAVASLLDAAAAERPLVVVLDDLHWADGDSLALLDFLATERRASPVAVVATYREEEAVAGTPLAEALGSLARHSAPTRIELTGLGRVDLRRYAAAITGSEIDEATVDLLQSQTAGNPFFVGELVRLLSSERRLGGDRAAEQVPSGVRDVVRRRLDRLPDDSQAVLRVGAVIGGRFGLDELAAACRLDLDAVLDALEPPIVSGLVVEAEGGEEFRFAHALVAAALAEDLPATRRRRLHARVAQAIEEVHADGTDAVASRLAHHYGEAMAVGFARQAADHARRAAAQAAASGACVEAARLWRLAGRALELDAGSTAEERIDAGIELAVALARLAQAESRDVVAQVVAQAVDAGDVPRGVRAALSLTEHSTSWGWAAFRTSPRHVTDQLDRLLDLIGPEDSIERALVLSVRAFGWYYTDADRSHALSSEALAMARRLGDDAVVVRCLAVHLVDLERPGEVDDLIAACTELIELAERIGDPRAQVIGHASRMCARLEVCDVAGADEDHRRARELLESVPVPALEQQITLYAPMRAVLAGDLAAAEVAAERAYELGRLRSMWDPETQYLTHVVEIRREQGRLDEMEEVICAVAADPSQGATNLAAVPALQRGDLDEARRIVAAHGGIVPPADDWRWFGEAVWATDVAVGIGDLDACAWLAAALAPYAGRLARTGTIVSIGGPIDLYLGRLHAALGDRDAARAAFAASLAVCRAIGAAGWEVESLVGLGEVLGGEDGAALLREGLAAAERMGRRPAADAARRALDLPD
jgi:DNA-binding SARP family transcriptional activator